MKRINPEVSVLLVVLAGCNKPNDSAAQSSAHAADAKATASADAKSEGPKHKSITAGFCLGPDGTSQDCGISCKVDKDPDTCAKWAEKTKAICGKISKAECQDICTKDENPTACDIAKSMK